MATLDSYHTFRQVGIGEYGAAYKCKDVKKNRIYIMKKVPVEFLLNALPKRLIVKIQNMTSEPVPNPDHTYFAVGEHIDEESGDTMPPCLVVTFLSALFEASQVVRSLDKPLLAWSPLSLAEFSNVLSQFQDIGVDIDTIIQSGSSKKGRRRSSKSRRASQTSNNRASSVVSYIPGEENGASGDLREMNEASSALERLGIDRSTLRKRFSDIYSPKSPGGRRPRSARRRSASKHHRSRSAGGSRTRNKSPTPPPPPPPDDDELEHPYEQDVQALQEPSISSVSMGVPHYMLPTMSQVVHQAHRMDPGSVPSPKESPKKKNSKKKRRSRRSRSASARRNSVLDTPRSYGTSPPISPYDWDMQPDSPGGEAVTGVLKRSSLERRRSAHMKREARLRLQEDLVRAQNEAHKQKSKHALLVKKEEAFIQKMTAKELAEERMTRAAKNKKRLEKEKAEAIARMAEERQQRLDEARKRRLSREKMSKIESAVELREKERAIVERRRLKEQRIKQQQEEIRQKNEETQEVVRVRRRSRVMSEEEAQMFLKDEKYGERWQ